MQKAEEFVLGRGHSSNEKLLQMVRPMTKKARYCTADVQAKGTCSPYRPQVLDAIVCWSLETKRPYGTNYNIVAAEASTLDKHLPPTEGVLTITNISIPRVDTAQFLGFTYM